MPQPHYAIRIPVEFTHWIKDDDPRFGSDPNSIADEISVDYNEFMQHNNEFSRWLGDIGLTVYNFRLFRSYPGSVYQLHRDIDPTAEYLPAFDRGQYQYERIIKINMIFNSQGSTMNWYSQKRSTLPLSNILSNPQGYAALKYFPEQCQLQYSTSCDTHCLINGGRIHNLINSENQTGNRYCYSIFISNSKLNLTWKEATILLKDYIA